MRHHAVLFAPMWIALLLGLSWGCASQTVRLAPRAPDAPLPRIAIMPAADGAFFTVKSSDVPLLIKGFNYIPLSQGWHVTFNAATKTTPACYDPLRAERMFTALEANGFNTVRVLIIGCALSMNPAGIAGDQDTQGLYQPYMENVLDFLRRARRHGIYVLPSFGDGELPSNGYYQSMLNPNHREAPNSTYFTKEGITAKARYVADFLNDIKSKDHGLLTTLVGIECQNELCVYDNQWPFTIRQGSLKMPNGKSYDMADPVGRRALMDEGLRYYLQAVVRAVKQVDPEMLVCESVFTLEAVGKSGKKYRGILPPVRYRDHRYPPDLVSLGGDAVEFLDVHYYRSISAQKLGDDFRKNMRSSLFYSPAMAQIRKSKPLIMGEFGDYRYPRYKPAEFVVNVVALRDLALASGFQGFLYWTYDTLQKEFPSAVENGGILFKALAAPAK